MIQQQLRETKKTKKLTNRELAITTGLTEMTITNSLKDKSTPTLKTITLLSQALGFEVVLKKQKS